MFGKAALLLGLLPLGAYAGMYGQPVVNLDGKTFKQVMATEHAAMVAFVAPWCGHCKNLGPEYTAAAQSLTPLIPFYAVDCDASQNKALCAEYGIQGFPTIKAFPRAGKGAARDYNGERQRGALIEHAKGLVPDRVKKLRIDDGAERIITKFIDEKPDLPHALLIHPSAPSIPFLWKVLGHRLSSKMQLGYIRDSTDHAVISSLGIYDPADTTKDTARAVVWQPGASRQEVMKYEGELKFNALLEWLQAHIDDTAPPPSPKRSKSPTPESKPVEPDAKARRQAKLDEAERRDKARREKAAAQKAASGGSKVEEAPRAVPEKVAEESQASYENSRGDAPEPVPKLEVENDVDQSSQPEQTIVHEEL